MELLHVLKSERRSQRAGAEERATQRVPRRRLGTISCEHSPSYVQGDSSVGDQGNHQRRRVVLESEEEGSRGRGRLLISDTIEGSSVRIGEVMGEAPGVAAIAEGSTVGSVQSRTVKIRSKAGAGSPCSEPTRPMGGSTGSFPPLAPFFMAAQADPSSVFQAVQTGWGRDLMESRDTIDASIVTSAMNLLRGVASSRVLEACASQETPVQDDVTLEEQWIRVRKARIQELETQLLSLHRQMEQERSGRAQDQAALAEMKLFLRREQEKVVEARESLARERARAGRLEQQVARHGEFMSTAATQFFQLVMDVLRDYYPMVHLNENFIRTEVMRRWEMMESSSGRAGILQVE